MVWILYEGAELTPSPIIPRLLSMLLSDHKVGITMSLANQILEL